MRIDSASSSIVMATDMKYYKDLLAGVRQTDKRIDSAMQRELLKMRRKPSGSSGR